jgi:4-coumarate--CoA ligase
LFRVVRDLVAADVSRTLHGHGLVFDRLCWTETTLIGGPGLSVDSLQLLQLATAVNRFFRIYQSGIEDSLLRDRHLGEWAEIAVRAREAGSRGFAFHTSGSSGEPVEHVHDDLTLAQEAGFLAGLFSGARRVVALVPAHHIYGFLHTVLLPLQLGVEVVDAEPGVGLSAILQAGDLVVGHPLVWRVLQEQKLRFPPGVTGVTSTAPCPPERIEALRAAGLERMMEIYGATETGGIGFRSDPCQPFQLFPYWQFADGPLMLSRRQSGPAGETHGSMAPPDRLQLCGDREFVPQGRHDSRVQVGGVNVSPQEIARRLQTHPWIAACQVRRMRMEEGERLKAFLVPASGRPPSAAEREELSAWMRAHLSPAELPVRLTFGPALPLNPQGKPRDWVEDEGWALPESTP